MTQAFTIAELVEEGLAGVDVVREQPDPDIVDLLPAFATVDIAVTEFVQLLRKQRRAMHGGFHDAENEPRRRKEVAVIHRARSICVRFALTST